MCPYVEAYYKYASYRMTGVGIELEIAYDGECKNEGCDITASVTVKKDPNWINAGDSIEYLTYPKLQEDGLSPSRFHNRYFRGIKVEVTFSGQIRTWNFTEMVNQFTNLLVLLGFATTVTGLFANYGLGYKSSVYVKSQTEAIHINEVHQAYATTVLQAAMSYRRLVGVDPTEDEIKNGVDHARLVEVFMKFTGRSQKDANILANMILQEDPDDPDAGKKLKFDRFANLLTTDVTELQDVIDHPDVSDKGDLQLQQLRGSGTWDKGGTRSVQIAPLEVEEAE